MSRRYFYGKRWAYGKRIMYLFITVIGLSLHLSLSAKAVAYGNGGMNGNDYVNYEEDRAVTEAAFLQEGVRLKEGNYERWIDRIELSEELKDFDMMDFYHKLEEGTDGDGVDDILIEDTYFDGEHSIKAVVIRRPYEVGMDLGAVMQQEYDKYQSAVMAVYCAFDRDHPEVFWLSGKWQSMITAEVRGKIYEMTISFLLQDNVQEEAFDIRVEEYRGEKEIKEAIQEREKRIEKILEASEGKTAYEKVVDFYTFLVKKNSYYTGAAALPWGERNSTCISALMGSAGTEGPICEGYARAFKVLCDRAEIPCVLVDGWAKSAVDAEREQHMWNYVKLYGNWYGVDVTFGDPITEGERKISGFENSNYLLVGRESIIEDIKFRKSHPVGNLAAEGVIAFTNGPVLSRNAYVRRKTEGSDIKFFGNPPVNGYVIEPEIRWIAY